MKKQAAKSKQVDYKFFKKFKTYSAAEIIAAGGTTEFAKLTGYDHERLFNLRGEPLTDEELDTALEDLKSKWSSC